jgi:hypothetical protein
LLYGQPVLGTCPLSIPQRFLRARQRQVEVRQGLPPGLLLLLGPLDETVRAHLGDYLLEIAGGLRIIVPVEVD